MSKEELEKIEEIDLIIGNNEKKDIVQIVEEYIKQKERKANIVRREIVTDISKQKDFIDFGTATYIDRTRLVIKVQDGCDNFCSYCIIPYAKGRVRSRQIDSIITEIREAVNRGIKEVVITGIQISSYGKDFENNIGLINLLEEINKISNLKRIRLGSLEPNIITEEFVSRLNKLDKICNHFHLSLQSGCDETLKRMNRKYSANQFEEKVKLLRNTFKDVAITTDIIVGFPGETEDEFKKTYEFLMKIALTKMHVFKYSPRKGTVASKMKEQISAKIKEERSKKLIELSNQNEENFINKYLNKTVEVLFEQKESEFIKGHTKNYIVVKSLYYSNMENKMKNVQIEKQEGIELIGKPM